MNQKSNLLLRLLKNEHLSPDDPAIKAIMKYKYARMVQASSGPVITLYDQSQDDSDEPKEQTQKDPE